MHKRIIKLIGQLVYDTTSPKASGLGWVADYNPVTHQYKIHWQDGSTTNEYRLFVFDRHNKYLDFREKVK